MLSFDTISLEAPLQTCMEDMKKNHARYQVKNLISNVTDTIQEVYSIGIVNCSDILGISRIEADANKDRLTMTFSAKILGRDYWKLNNSDTILQSLEAINQNECIIINPQEVLDTATIHRIDVTRDISFQDICTPEEAIRAIKLVTNPKYCISRYDGGGISIRKNIKDPSAERLIFYNKAEELKLSRNKELCKVFNPETLAGKVRAEMNLRDFIRCRSYLKTNEKGKIFLKDALRSTASPALRFWKNYEGSYEIPSLFEDIRDFTDFRTFQDRKGWDFIIQNLEKASQDDKNPLHDVKFYVREMLGQFNYSASGIRKILRKEVEPIIQEIIHEKQPYYSRILNHMKANLENIEGNLS